MLYQLLFVSLTYTQFPTSRSQTLGSVDSNCTTTPSRTVLEPFLLTFGWQLCRIRKAKRTRDGDAGRRRTTEFAKVKKAGGPGWPPPTVGSCSRERGLLWLIHLTLTLHLFVLLHHFLLHLLPFGLLVRCQDGVDLLRGRLVEFLHLCPFIRRG